MYIWVYSFMHEGIVKWNDIETPWPKKRTFIDKIFLSIWQQFVCRLRSFMFDFPIQISFSSRRCHIIQTLFFILLFAIGWYALFGFDSLWHHIKIRTEQKQESFTLFFALSRYFFLFFLSIDRGIGMFLLALLVKSTKMFTKSSLLFFLVLCCCWLIVIVWQIKYIVLILGSYLKIRIGRCVSNFISFIVFVHHCSEFLLSHYVRPFYFPLLDKNLHALTFWLLVVCMLLCFFSIIRCFALSLSLYLYNFP